MLKYYKKITLTKNKFLDQIIKIKDYIFVNIKNFYFEQLSKKLNFKFYNLYFINKIIDSYAY